MPKQELFFMLTNYLCANNPYEMNQKLFDELVKIEIKNNQKERLWRLALNYEPTKIKYSGIIKTKDQNFIKNIIEYNE